MKKRFWTVAILSRLFLIFIALFLGIGLMSDEAQYWTWSQNLSYGYYSKPPGIAWQIFSGTLLFGNTELGVRFLSLLISLFSSLLIQRITYILTKDEKASYLAALSFLLSPLGLSSALFATTDGGFSFFLLLAVWQYMKHEDSPKRLLYFSFWILVGALWKWMIFTLWIPILFYELTTRRFQGVPFIKALLLSTLGLLPSLFWNIQHGFPTFFHVYSTVSSSHETRSNFFSFLIASSLLISPGFLFLGFRFLFQKKLIPIFLWTIWGGLIFLSLFRKVQGNWAAATQVLFFPLLGYYFVQSWKKSSLITSIFISLLLQGVLWCGPLVGGKLLEWSPLKPGLGNDKISEILLKTGYDPEKDFLFSDRYQTVSELFFYGPKQKKAYFLNIHNLRQNQFSYWKGMHEECLKKTGYFVAIIPYKESHQIPSRTKRFQELLQPYFQSIIPLPSTTLYTKYGFPIKCMIILKCENYLGTEPHAPITKY